MHTNLLHQIWYETLLSRFHRSYKVADFSALGHISIAYFDVDKDYNPDEQMMKGVKVEAPSFDGQIDPTKFLDWLADMDRYFKWYYMSEER